MGKRSKFGVGFFFKLVVGRMTPHGLNTVGTSQENTQCTSRIYSGPDAASPAARLLLAHSPALPKYLL